jgi:hypothetical protein
LLGDEIRHRTHLFDRVDGLIDADELAELIDTAEPLAQVLNHCDANSV